MSIKNIYIKKKKKKKKKVFDIRFAKLLSTYDKRF